MGWLLFVESVHGAPAGEEEGGGGGDEADIKHHVPPQKPPSSSASGGENKSGSGNAHDSPAPNAKVARDASKTPRPIARGSDGDAIVESMHNKYRSKLAKGQIANKDGTMLPSGKNVYAFVSTI